MRMHLPPCDDWTEVSINNKLVDIITRVSGRVFVGPDLCQDQEYLDCGSNYTIVLSNAVQAIKHIRPWLRPFLAPRLPEMAKLRAMEARATKHLEPIVRERMEAEKNDPNWQKPEDMMQWLLNRSAEHGAVTVEQIAKTQLGLIFAAIHTTTMTATNIIYTLAVTPEYIQPLREEIRQAMNDNDGQITTRALQQMVKLDSYMKEVTRVYPPGISTYFHNFKHPKSMHLTLNPQHPSAAACSKASHSPTANTSPPASCSKSPHTPSTRTRPSTPKPAPLTASATPSCVKAAAPQTTRATSSSRRMNRISRLDTADMRVPVASSRRMKSS
jgi:hypothetical protein